jgi:predicted lipoprotein
MIVAAAFLTLVIGATAPQTAAAPQNASGNQPAKNAPVTLNGCVEASQTAKNAFTLDEDGRTYVLKGVDVREFVGKQVEVIGALPKRFTIVGGLYPSANVAGQAGAIDPTKAAIAAQSGPTSQSSRPTVDFTVKSVRLLPGTCETPK